MAAQATTSDVTWRDAVTPLSRASRRRWTACYALLLVIGAAGVVDDAFATDRGSDETIPLLLLVAIPVVFGMLRRGTRRITALDHPDLDERDIAARNSAYRVAFPLFGLVVVATLAGLVATLHEAVRTNRAGDVNVPIDGWFIDSNVIAGLAVWFLLWAVFLPTGVLAWREPDALESETEEGRLSETIRDALLGLALAGGFAIVLVANTDAGLWPFVATLALLGALGRRAAGQPIMSRQRKLRVAIGIGLILVMIVAGLLVSAGGGNG